MKIIKDYPLPTESVITKAEELEKAIISFRNTKISVKQETILLKTKENIHIGY